jgi:dolichol-phosphate mannosyltransferase
MAIRSLVVIPAYNEESTIVEVVEGAIVYSDVIVVDDCSKDTTPFLLDQLKKKFPKKFFTIRHEKNTHIPDGIQDGMKFANANGYEWVVTMDAGMSHDPKELPLFLNGDPSYDLIIGRRGHVMGVPMYRKIISWMAARVMNYCLEPTLWKVFGPGIRDCTSGYRRYSKRIFSEIATYPLESIAFDFHMEALSIAIQNKAKWKEIDITYIFSNSSFNKKVLKLAINFAMKLLTRKFGFNRK